jgi:hypothetical protein
VHRPLEARNKRIDYVYFIEAGFAVVANGSGKPSIEVGIIGREGMTGLAIVMGRVSRYLRLGCRQGSTDQSTQVARGRRAQQHASPGYVTLRSCIPSADHHNDPCQRTEQNRGAVGALAADGA